ncbi:putative membrane protein [Acinetobacter baumannii]|nr:putative membrane protein [Acinetobacter baumannii]
MMDDQNETEEKKTRKANLLEEFGGQLIDGFITLIGELFIYIIFLLFSGALLGIIFAAIFFGWGILFLLLPFAFLVYILFKKYSR